MSYNDADQCFAIAKPTFSHQKTPLPYGEGDGGRVHPHHLCSRGAQKIDVWEWYHTFLSQNKQGIMSLQNKERHDPYAALRNQDFRLLLTGRFITSFGNEMLSFTIGWELWLRTHQAFVLGMVGLVQVIPVILLSLPAGHVADQYNRKRIVLITELFLGFCVLVWDGYPTPRDLWF